MLLGRLGAPRDHVYRAQIDPVTTPTELFFFLFTLLLAIFVKIVLIQLVTLAHLYLFLDFLHRASLEDPLRAALHLVVGGQKRVKQLLTRLQVLEVAALTFQELVQVRLRIVKVYFFFLFVGLVLLLLLLAFLCLRVSQHFVLIVVFDQV